MVNGSHRRYNNIHCNNNSWKSSISSENILKSFIPFEIILQLKLNIANLIKSVYYTDHPAGIYTTYILFIVIKYLVHI